MGSVAERSWIIFPEMDCPAVTHVKSYLVFSCLTDDGLGGARAQEHLVVMLLCQGPDLEVRLCAEAVFWCQTRHQDTAPGSRFSICQTTIIELAGNEQSSS